MTDLSDTKRSQSSEFAAHIRKILLEFSADNKSLYSACSYEYDFFSSEHWLDQSVAYLSEIASFCSCESFLNTTITNQNKCSKKNKKTFLELPLVFWTSTIVDKTTNILLCSRGESLFFIGQNLSFCDYIYFVKERLFISVLPWGCHRADKHLGPIRECTSIILSRCEIDLKPSHFGGIYLGDYRPTHIFYDAALGVEKYFGSERINDCQVAVYSTKNYALFDPNHLHDSHIFKQLIIKTNQWINDYLAKSSQFLTKIAFPFGGKQLIQSKILLDSFDQRLSISLDKYVYTRRPSITRQIRHFKSKNYFILWYGICTGNRVLRQQLTILYDTVNYIYQHVNKNVCIVLDGYTESLTTPREEATKNRSDEQIRIASDIIRTLGPSISSVILIGEKYYTKAFVSKYINFFIAYGGYGSMWPSRFSSKPGVVHMAMNSRGVNTIYKPGTRIYPLLACRALGQNEDQRIDDYAVDQQHFLDFSRKAIEETMQGHKPSRINLFYILKSKDVEIDHFEKNLETCYKAVGPKPRIWLKTIEPFNIDDLLKPVLLIFEVKIHENFHAIQSKIFIHCGIKPPNESDGIIVKPIHLEKGFSIIRLELILPRHPEWIMMRGGVSECGTFELHKLDLISTNKHRNPN